MDNIVFAFWESDGFFYPAKIGNQKNGFAEASFLDGQSAMVKNDQFVKVADAFKNMCFQADWKKGGEYYGCKITSVNDDYSKFSVLYDDGAKEQVGLSQLRAYYSDDAEAAVEGKVPSVEDETPANATSSETNMEAICQRIKTTITFLCAGWLILCISVIGLGQVYPFIMLVGFILGVAVAAWPMISRIRNRGFGAIFDMPQYTVITTHADGRKSSDYGAESAAVTGIAGIIIFVIGVAIGIVATFIYLVILTIHYTVLYLKANPKPAFMQSAYFLILVSLVVLIGGVVLGAIMQNVIG
jgi:hypothetical protein